MTLSREYGESRVAVNVKDSASESLREYPTILDDNSGGAAAVAALSAGLPVAVGLHITKCAGTSLMTTVRRLLPDGQYYMCSSYYENLLAGRNVFANYVTTDDIIFMFGHFIHESLVAYFQKRPLYLFTGLREPVMRAASHLAQINTTRFRGAQPLLTAEEFLGEKLNGMCDEILRAFPSVAEDIEGGKFEKARGVLSMFDYIYDSSHINAQADHILAVVELAGHPLQPDNVTDKKVLDPDLVEFNRQQTGLLTEMAPQALADDIELYAAFQGQFGIGELNIRLADEPWAIPREKLFAKFPDPSAARRQFNAWEAKHFVYEFYLLGKLPEFKAALDERLGSVNQLLQEAVIYGV